MGDLIRARWRLVRPELLSGLIYSIHWSISITMRIRTENFPLVDSKCIICGWHGRSFIFGHHYRKRGYWVIISQSRDGDLQNSIFTRLGFRTIRGSTGRGGLRAAIEAIRALKAGGTMAMTPDGPRGPSHVVQGGVMTMAQKSGASLVPVGISARRRKLINSWDRFMVPAPFSEGVLIYGEPILVPFDADEDAVEALRLKLQSEMIRLEILAEERMGHPVAEAP